MTWLPSGQPRGGQRGAVGGYLPEAAEKYREGSQSFSWTLQPIDSS